MLVLTRKKDESIMIGDDVEIVITQIMDDRVKIGIRAPKHCKIYRKELVKAVEDENIKSAAIEKDKIESIKDLLVKK